MTILSHLILNDMVKVKGQISEMAVCLEDSNEKIANLAKMFFFELGQKVIMLFILELKKKRFIVFLWFW